jgi:4-hydroxysphinganine ceramide fatty acyl 2-hydroxylase
MNKYTKKEISSHHTTHDLWVVYKDKVYDLTSFLFDHPGGEEVLLSHGGSDISQILLDDKIHLHSDAALDILNDYCIGTISEKTGLPELPSNEAVALKDLNENFIDITKPMLRQVYYSTFTKEEYIKQVHIPRYSKDSPPIFGGVLENFTKTYWWVIPIFWGPFVYILYNWSRMYLSAEVATALWVAGLFSFTLIEYVLHRFLFHMDENLPDNRTVWTIHFLIHGVHHFLPMDRYF